MSSFLNPSLTPAERPIAAVLMRYGRYDETADSMAWLATDAAAIDAVLTDPPDDEAVVGALAETGWWDAETETDERARAVAADLGATS